MSAKLESVHGELQDYGEGQVRLELSSVFICDRRDEALELIRLVALLRPARSRPAPR